ncbi:MAG: bifunctional precorrin-2 dehydrogenase/sirohydrochlorin ferrochelatase [Dehalococcoidia bacterium]|nr:bifunctional precorrin-2 dehydrogenase/sirohydrochlorin ferrochelatase [Dehalococcoidia bacterium]
MKKRGHPPIYYPISLNISGKRCVVVGGGQVALRKVRTLLEHKAKVEVISPDLCSELGQLAESKEIYILRRKYRAGDLKGAFVAIAAANDRETNLRVAEEAQRNAVLVNVADDAENSDFILPSYLRQGYITIAISTGGRSPALARKIRTRLEKDFGDEYASLALLIDEVRAELKRQEIKVNGDAWQEALDLDLLTDLVMRGDNEKAKAVLLSNLKRQQR